MSEPVEELRQFDGIAAVRESDIPGIDYYVIPAPYNGVQHIRVTWLEHFRDDFKWAGKSHASTQGEFVLLVEK
jgi:hypothetical protein